MKPASLRIISALPVACLLLATGNTSGAIVRPTGLRAEGHDSRVDLIWDRVSDTEEGLFHVYRAEQAAGPWKKLTAEPHGVHVYSDFIGENGKTRTARRFGTESRGGSSMERIVLRNVFTDSGPTICAAIPVSLFALPGGRTTVFSSTRQPSVPRSWRSNQHHGRPGQGLPVWSLGESVQTDS